MMLRKMSLMVMAIVTMLFVQSCDNENSSSDTTARVQLKLVDAPGEYSKVIIDIVDVQYNSSSEEEGEGGWMSFESFTTPPEGGVDLLDLIDGEYLPLTDELIEVDGLKQIRLVLGDENYVVFKDESEEDIEPATHLDTPSAQQSGLKLKFDDVLQAGFSYIYTLDFDVQKSVVEAGNSGKFILKPVIRMSGAEATSGSISGNVVEFIDEIKTGIGNIRVDFIDEGDELNIGSTTTNDSGEFVIQGLKVGLYTLKIDNTVVGTANVLYELSIPDPAVEGVAVEVGVETPVDDIVLERITIEE